MFTALARRLLRQLDRLVALVHARRLRDRHRDLRVVLRAGTWYVAEPVRARPPAEVTADLVDWVVDVSADVGAEHAVVPAANPLRPRVSVAVESWPRVLDALQQRAPWLLWALPRDAQRPVPLDSLRPEAVPPVRLFRVTCLPGGGLLTGPDVGCDLILHERRNGWLELGMDNLVAERLPAEPVELETVSVLGRDYQTFVPLGAPGYASTVEFPVDVVYTWVDGDDPAWRDARDRHLSAAGEMMNVEATNPSRWTDREEFRYSLRSLHMHAPWVNHVWVVTEGHLPPWLDVDHPDLTVVTHDQLFRDAAHLPTFNSHAIEANLHRIPGLSEHYLYFNDDVHLGRPVAPELFFLPNGVAKFFPSRHQLDVGPAVVSDPPVMAAAKNGRDLLHERFGRIVTQKLKHTPHAQSRSVVDDLEREFPEAVARTSAARFRSPSDISLASSLVHHYGFLTERAVPANLAYVYVDLTDDLFHGFTDRLLEERHLEVFCINDTVGTPAQLARRGPQLQAFLEQYFPEPSPFER